MEHHLLLSLSFFPPFLLFLFSSFTCMPSYQSFFVFSSLFFCLFYLHSLFCNLTLSMFTSYLTCLLLEDAPHLKWVPPSSQMGGPFINGQILMASISHFHLRTIKIRCFFFLNCALLFVTLLHENRNGFHFI